VGCVDGIPETLITIIIHTIEQLGYVGVVAGMTLESTGLPVPSEVIMPFAGYVASTGKLTLVGVTVAGAAGCLVGSLIAYVIGSYGGRPLLERYGKYLLIRKDGIDRAQEWFERHGELAVFISRLLPIVRTYISFPAGIVKMDVTKFSVYTFLGSLVWCFALAYVGFTLGRNWSTVEGMLGYLTIAVAIGMLVVFAYVLYHRKKIVSRVRP
jgi:membrane protein DedA with SNARE-associated domain